MMNSIHNHVRLTLLLTVIYGQACTNISKTYDRDRALRKRAQLAEQEMSNPTSKTSHPHTSNQTSSTKVVNCHTLACLDTQTYLRVSASADTLEQAESRAKGKLAALIQSEVQGEITTLYKEIGDEIVTENQIINKVSSSFKHAELIKTIRIQSPSDSKQVEVIAYLHRQTVMRRLNRDYQEQLDLFKSNIKELANPETDTKFFIEIWQGIPRMLHYYYEYIRPYYSIMGTYPPDHQMIEKQLQQARNRLVKILKKSKVRISIVNFKEISAPLALLIQKYLTSRSIRASLSGECSQEGYDLLLKGKVEHSTFTLTNKPMTRFTASIQIVRCQDRLHIHQEQLPIISGIARENRSAKSSLIKRIRSFKFKNLSQIKNKKRRELNKDLIEAVKSSMKGILPL